MAVEIQGKVGPIVAADSTLNDPRLGRDGASVVTDLHGARYEQASRGKVFHASTAAAGIAPGTVLAAAGALLLANPAASGFNVAILKLVFGYVSGTLGVGHLWWVQGANPAALPAETTAATRSSGLISPAASGDVAKAFSGVSLTTVPTVLRPTAISLDPYAGTAAPLTLQPMQVEDVNGSIVIPPGFFAGVEGIAAAGTSPLVLLAFEYEIVPQ